ncbi:MAG: type II toxin-antitoxin system RelE/ParE family toxin [Sporichthyaceae bacterium]
MTGGSPHELVLPASRATAEGLPEAVATSVVDFLTAGLVANPHRTGKPLREYLAGIWSARRGTYRALYRINEEAREVIVLRVEHRLDAYRPM